MKDKRTDTLSLSLLEKESTVAGRDKINGIETLPQKSNTCYIYKKLKSPYSLMHQRGNKTTKCKPGKIYEAKRLSSYFEI